MNPIISTMMKYTEQTIVNTFNNCQVFCIVGRSHYGLEILKLPSSYCKRLAFIMNDDSDRTVYFS